MKNNTIQEPLLASQLELLSNEYARYEADAKDKTLTDKQRRESSIVANIYLASWYDLMKVMHPKATLLDGINTHDPEKPLISFSVQQLKDIIAKAEETGTTGNTIHVCSNMGILEVFVVNPDIDNGGREIHRTPAILTNNTL